MVTKKALGSCVAIAGTSTTENFCWFRVVPGFFASPLEIMRFATLPTSWLGLIGHGWPQLIANTGVPAMFVFAVGPYCGVFCGDELSVLEMIFEDFV